MVLTTHYLEEAERLADRIAVIDHGRLIASGSPLELTRGGRSATIRLVVTKPFPADAPESRRAPRGGKVEVPQRDEGGGVVDRPAHPASLGIVSRWCEANDVLPESLTLGQRTLEDVFLELTGRALTT